MVVMSLIIARPAAQQQHSFSCNMMMISWSEIFTIPLEDVSPQICRHEDPTMLEGALQNRCFIQPTAVMFTNNSVCCHLSQLLPSLDSQRSVTAGQVS